MNYRICNPLEKFILRSAASEAGDSKDALNITDFIVSNSCCNSCRWFVPDSVGLIKVIEIQFVRNGEDFDDYRHRIGARVRFIKGYFLEHYHDSKTIQMYKLSKKSYFYSDSVIYPCFN